MEYDNCKSTKRTTREAIMESLVHQLLTDVRKTHSEYLKSKAELKQLVESIKEIKQRRNETHRLIHELKAIESTKRKAGAVPTAKIRRKSRS